MCDCLVALAPATADGVTLFAKNSDRSPDEAQDLAWFPRRFDRGPLRTTYLEIEPHPVETLGCLLSRPEWCWGAEHGVNEAGVAIGNETIYTTLDPRDFPPALIGMDLVRLGLERASTAAVAVEVITSLLDRYGQGGSGHGPDRPPRPYWSSFLVADPTAAYVVETSGRTYAVEQVYSRRAISNRTTIAAFDAVHRHPRQPTHRFVDARLAASDAVLAAGAVTVDGLIAHLRSHDSHAPGEPGWSVCMHVEGVERTTASIIAELPVGGVPTAWVVLGSPCERRYMRLPVDGSVTPPSWDDWPALSCGW